jgi:hypothetical protein
MEEHVRKFQELLEDTESSEIYIDSVNSIEGIRFDIYEIAQSYCPHRTAFPYYICSSHFMKCSFGDTPYWPGDDFEFMVALLLSGVIWRRGFSKSEYMTSKGVAVFRSY